MSDQKESENTEMTEAVVEITPVEGVENPTFTQEQASLAEGSATDNPAFQSEEPSGPEEIPPLTYIDFEPRCLGSTIEGKEPSFAPFSSVVEQANQWLIAMPQFSVIRCETISVRLGNDFKLDSDCSLSRVSSNGRNVYLKTLRLWLTPKTDTAAPVQQIAYITVLPQHNGGDLSEFLANLTTTSSNRAVADVQMSSFDNIQTTVAKLNKHLNAKPLPGKILTVETLALKCHESNTSDKMDAESTTCSETGLNSRLYLNALRVFYVVGQPAFETLGVFDQEPDMLQSREGMGLKIKFSTFDSTVAQTSQWLKQQQGIRLVNIQSVNVKLERKGASGAWHLDSNTAGFTESQTLQEQRYTKILRVAYVTDQKLESPTPYSSMTLTSRLFVPNRIEGRSFESFSKNQLRVIKWLNATNNPLFACETVKYQVSAEGTGAGFNEDRTDYMVNTYHGQHYITCIRLYFPCQFQEPPPEVGDEEDQGWGAWACVVS